MSAPRFLKESEKRTLRALEDGRDHMPVQLAATTDRWAIDGTAFEWQGGLYFVWSGWPGTTDGQQNLYIAEMRNPWTLRGDRVLISTPQYSWEKFGLPISFSSSQRCAKVPSCISRNTARMRSFTEASMTRGPET